jgi:endonuclease/exonuclease/phosphatase family metal-dependent hydrolase
LSSRRIDALPIASLNLHCGVDARAKPYDVAGAIGRLDATVICLQEDWVPGSAREPAGADQVGQTADTLGATLYRAPIWPGVARPVLGIPADGGRGDLCISVLTTLPVTSYEVVPLGHGPGDAVPRYAQVLQLRAPGGALRLVNTHLSASVASPLQLLRLWRRLRTDPVPTVLAGDLNMPALVVRRYGGLTGLVRGATFPADQPVVQLDHILVSRVGDAGDARVMAPIGSDHRPIRALVSLNGQR